MQTSICWQILDKWKFTFRENYLSVNDLKLNFSGYVAMPGDDIETDIQFKTPQTEFQFPIITDPCSIYERLPGSEDER